MNFATSLALILTLFLSFRTASTQYGVSYMEPRLECLNDGIRLHVNPVGQFVGHVYVKGFFFGQSCHLDYCKEGVRQPFSMEIPYKGNCNVRRHRTPIPAAITYEVTVVVQHHPLFITAGDRAYRLNCIYKQENAMVTQKININELPSVPLSGMNLPSCRYDVLAGSLNGPTLHFANVGDPVVHKWTCQSDHHGLLVHSCSVRDEAGAEYKLIDERGCVTDSSLVQDVVYSTDLSMAHTTINAFRFADQIMIHFACQITLCRKSEQGCEGITPPICRPIDFPPIRTEYKHSSTPNLHSRQDHGSNQLFFEKTTLPTREWSTLPSESRTTNGYLQTASSRKTINQFTTDEENWTTLGSTQRISHPTVSPSSHKPYSPQTSTEEKVTTDGLTTTQEIYDSFTQNTLSRLNYLDSSKLNTLTTKRKEYGLEIVSVPFKSFSLVRNQEFGSTTPMRNLNLIPSTLDPTYFTRSSPHDNDLESTVEDNSYSTYVLSSTFDATSDDNIEPLPYPAAAEIYYANRKTRSNPEVRENITLEVEAKKILIFSSDDSSERLDFPKWDSITRQKTTRGETILLCACTIMQVISVAIIFIQRHIYRRSIKEISSKLPRDIY